MRHEIAVSVRQKIAEAEKDALYVCGNSDYVIVFDFDEDWDEHEVKTARFTYKGGHTDMVFTGSECPVPVISNTYSFNVGVYAGNLETSTAARVACKKSILCDGGPPHDPPPDVYAQIMEMLNYIKDNGATDEQIAEAVTKYLDEHPIEGGVDEEQLAQAVESALQTAKESGEFDGPAGQDGRDGSDGVSASHEWNGTTLIMTSASGTSSADLKGDKGDPGYTPQKGVDYFDGKDGPAGEPGKDGYTPQKGVDYFDGADGEPGKDGYTPQKGVDYFDGATGAIGPQGPAGYSPVKGTDYWTAADIAEIDAHIDQKISAAKPGDYVIEAGTSGIWTYEKWNSGKAICSGTLKEKKTNYTVVNGFNGYYSSNAPYPTGLFVSPPIMMHSSKVGNGFVIDGGDVQNAADHAAAYALCTASGEVNCVWNFYCVGRWK